jgi:hypothetical protein
MGLLIEMVKYEFGREFYSLSIVRFYAFDIRVEKVTGFNNMHDLPSKKMVSRRLETVALDN